MDTIYTCATDTTFPLLATISDAPKSLYAIGTLPQKEYKYLCVVGTRSPTAYGAMVVEKLLAGLTQYPICIVSGLALGIDGIAHEQALALGLPTIAVPGSGLREDVLYPRRHRILAKKIVSSGGLLLSEFEPDFTAQMWSFPKRNRIMAGLSHATLIIEATEKSGTLITARLALEYGREVLAVPGSIYSATSQLPHALIRDGATPIRSPEDILEALGISTYADTPPQPRILSAAERAVLSIISREPMERDVLLRELRMPPHEAITLFSAMELRGLLREQGGYMYPSITYTP